MAKLQAVKMPGMPEDPFEVPDAPAAPVTINASKSGRVTVDFVDTDMEPRTWRVVIDRQLVIARFGNALWATAFMLVLGEMLPAEGGTCDAVDQAMDALKDLSGARALVASVLERAALKQSTDVSPAAVLVDAAQRLRGVPQMQDLKNAGEQFARAGIGTGSSPRRQPDSTLYRGLLYYDGKGYTRTAAKGFWYTPNHAKLLEAWKAANRIPASATGLDLAENIRVLECTLCHGRNAHVVCAFVATSRALCDQCFTGAEPSVEHVLAVV